MSILAVIFGILSGCFLAVLVGIIGSHRRIGFGWAFLISLIFTPLVGLIVALLTDPLPGGGQLCFTDRAGKQLPLGTYYRFTR